MKKIILLFIVFSIILITPICSEEKERASYISQSIGNYLFESEEYDNDANYYIGGPIFFWIKTDEGYLPEKGKILYPVYSEAKQLLFTYLVCGDSGKISTMFNEMLFERMSNKIKFAIVKDNDLYRIINESDNEFIESEEFSQINYQYEYELIQVVSNLVNNVNLGNQEISQVMPNACWAACMAWMINKYTGTNLTTNNVLSTLHESGYNTKTAAQVTSYLLTYYDIYAYSSTSVSSACSTIRNNLYNGKGYIFGWKLMITDSNGNNSTPKHMTVCYGYEYDGNKYKYRIMDPGAINGEIANSYVVETSSASSMPINWNVFVNNSSSYTLVSCPLECTIVYNRYEPYRNR